MSAATHDVVIYSVRQQQHMTSLFTVRQPIGLVDLSNTWEDNGWKKQRHGHMAKS